MIAVVCKKSASAMLGLGYMYLGLVFLNLLMVACAESPPLPLPPTAYLETVTLPSVLKFGFFAGVTVREPTQEEVDGLLVQTTRFYSDLLSTQYPLIFEDLTLDLTLASFDAISSSLFPVQIEFDTRVTFFVETAASVPTRQELGDVMKQADYSSYIQDFVWTAEPPQGLFGDVQRVAFDSDDDPNFSSDAPTYSPTYLPWSVGLELRMAFGLADDGQVRVPTPEEFDAWKQVTHDFFLANLQSKYPGHCHEDDYCHEFIESMTVDVLETFLDDRSSSRPIIIHWSARIGISTGISIEAMPTREQLYADFNCVDFDDYIQNHVRTSGPEGGIFSFAQLVKLFRRNGDNTYQHISSPCGPPITAAPTMTAGSIFTIEITSTMRFRFFPEATIREPTKAEIQGVRDQINAFFLQVLREYFGSNILVFDILLHEQDTYLDASSSEDFPVVIEFTAFSFFFYEEFLPPNEEVLGLLESADFASFVQYFAWQSDPVDSIFHETKSVAYNGILAGPTGSPTIMPSPTLARTRSPIITTSPTLAPTHNPEHVRLVTVKATMDFGLDQNASIREPTLQERVMNQTSRFFTKQLKTKYPNRLDSVKAKYVKSYLVETNSLYPIRIEFDAEAFFVEEALVPSEEDLFEKMDSADFDDDYIQSYVRNSPQETGMFHQTQRVDFKRRHQVSERDKWVYCVDPTTDSLYILDSATGKKVKTILTLDGYRAPVGMAESSEYLYVFNNAPTALLKIDPGSLEVTEISTGGPKALSLAFGNGKLFTKLENSRDLVALDLETGEPTIACPKIFPSSEVGGLETDPHNGLLYGVQAYNSDSAKMYTIDPILCSFTRICTMELPGVNGGLSSLVFNPTTDMFLASLDPNLVFDLDIDCTITNVRQTEGHSPGGMAMYFRPSDDDFDPTPSPTSTGTPSLTHGPTTTGAPSLASGPTSSGTPSLTYGPTATGAPSLTYEPTATGAPSLTDAPTPGYPTISCYDFWSEGDVLDGKCYAVDISLCTEESATCTFVESFYEYYNQYTTNVGSTRETYAYVSVLAAYDCVDRPDECSINVAGVNCNECTNDGRTVTMVDCTNIPEGVMEETFAPAPQTISLSEGGGSFDIIGTDNMCNHPSVVAVADRSFAKMASKDTSVSDYSFIVPSELHFQFAEGTGADLDFNAIARLMTKTLEFFKTVLPLALDPASLDTIEIDNVHTDFDETEPDNLVVFFNTNIDLKSSSTITSRNVLHAMATADWNKYVDQYVHEQKGAHAAIHGVLDGVFQVIFRGIGRES